MFDGTLENTDSEPDSPAQLESLEMQRMEDAQEAVEVDRKSKLQRSQSEDYKANTPWQISPSVVFCSVWMEHLIEGAQT